MTKYFTSKVTLIIIFFFFIQLSPSHAEGNNPIDSLKNELKSAVDTNRLSILYDLSVLTIVNSPEKAIGFANQLLAEAEGMDRKDYISSAYTMLGEGYFYQNNINKSTEYFKKDLELHKNLQNLSGMADAYNNLGIVYKNTGNQDKALEYYKNSLELDKKLKDSSSLASSYNNIGVLYFKKEDYQKALDYYKKSYKIELKWKKPESLATSMLNIGEVYGRMGNLSKARNYLTRSVLICDSFKLGITKEYAVEALASVYEYNKEYAKALDYYKQLQNLRNKRINEQTNKRIAELQVKYETAKSKKQIAELNKQKNIHQILIFSSVFVISVILIFTLLLIRQSRKRKEANEALQDRNAEIMQQKEEIEAQRDEIETQRNEIKKQRNLALSQKEHAETQKKEITDSIEYAKHIQEALLPDLAQFKEKIKNGFCLFMPRDIVSGDFYWLTKIQNKTIIVTADCTGHGVPGAFMSIIGITYLNEIINNENVDDPAIILNKLRDRVVKTLITSEKFDEYKESMEISVCSFDWENNFLQFAGAYNHLFYIRDNELNILKADNMPIGISNKKQKAFTNSSLYIKENDMFYMFTDGYYDQFGGVNKKKFMLSTFKTFLLNIHKEKPEKQKELLVQKFNEWKNNYEQIDDVLILGFRV